MPFLAPAIDNADPLFALIITPGLYLLHVEVADQDPASGSLYAYENEICDGLRFHFHLLRAAEYRI